LEIKDRKGAARTAREALVRGSGLLHSRVPVSLFRSRLTSSSEEEKSSEAGIRNWREVVGFTSAKSCVARRRTRLGGGGGQMEGHARFGGGRIFLDLTLSREIWKAEKRSW